MKRIVRWSMITLSIGAVVGVAFYVGATVGFVEGEGTAIGSNAAFEAFFLTNVLNDLRSRHNDKALTSLEGDLDSQLMAHGLHVLLGPPRFEITRAKPVEGFKLLQQVAAYREKYPPESEDPKVRSTLEGILRCLHDAPFNVSQERLREYLRACYRANW